MKQRLKNYSFKPDLSRTAIVLLGLTLLLVPALVAADTTITQSFKSETKLAIGSIVSLKNDTSDEVNAATLQNADNIYGVVINADESLLQLSNDEHQVQVATSGIISVLASDINDEIKQGDYITASAIEGIGMKASGSVKAVGVAQGGIAEAGSRTDSYEVNGEQQEITLGEVPVLIDVSYFSEEPEKTIIPPTIQNIANTIAGRPIKPLPIIVSAVIFVVTMIAVASILFSMIRGSIISVGRNPMSQSAVYRNVMQISALVLAILAVATAAIYLVLTRF